MFNHLIDVIRRIPLGKKKNVQTNVRPNPGLSSLEKKANAIASMALKAGFSEPGSAYFINFLKIRQKLPLIRKFCPTPEKQRQRVLDRFLDGPIIFKENLCVINRWLESMGRPDLKLTEQEMLDMILK